MKETIVSIALVLLACSWAAAESSVWKAQKGNSVIYLGGTFHLLRKADYPLPPEFDQAYRAADVVLFETAIDMLQKPETLQKLQAKAMYADGSTVDQHLSPRTYGELSAYCDANGIPLQTLRQLRPSLLMVTLTVMELQKLGVSEMGVDQFFHEQAVQEGKTVVGLETVDEQLNYVVSLADGNEDAFVSYSLTELQTAREQFATLAQAWRAGDAGKLAALLVSELKTRQPQLYQKLIVARNRKWLPVITSRQQPHRTRFVLVGAAHLVGPDGIIEALRKQGYRVDKL